ncbi:MAG TPA: 1,4-dihydroxy-2-naphthoate octaprenyltransferase [Azospira sp.]|nr:1,4-dihydroxy-2-naphthoate octaprenyltransferase [Azospira sp.]
MSVSAAPRPSLRQAWWLALRPRTLTVAAAPVLATCALVWAETGKLRWLTALVTLLAALLIQIGTNLLNDVGDFERGTDTPDRLGPPRATAMGWLSAAQVKRGGFVALGAAFFLGIYLVGQGGWPIVLLGIASLICGWAYTGGPKPIAYGPFGEVFVWLFFGLGAVLGTYYLQTGAASPAAWALANMLGLFAAAVIVVNNTRDRAGDARSGKRTLAVRLGLPACRVEYGLLMLAPFVLLGWLAAAGHHLAAGLPLLALPPALLLVVRFARLAPGPGHNLLLGRTAQLQLFFSFLLILGCLL